MPYCPKCGNEVLDGMRYCPSCGFLLGSETPSGEVYEKHEKHEKHEKEEKGEKSEKHEKEEVSRFWVLVGGAFLLIIGIMSLTADLLDVTPQWRGAFFLVLVGTLIVVLAIYGATAATRRNPRP